MVEIVLEGPGKNALSTATLTQLTDRLRDAGGAPVLLTGAGDAMSAGLNLKEVSALADDGMLDFLRLLERTVTALYLYPGPTVALVNGHAIAGGCVLTLCCDYRVMTAEPRARIGLNEIALGVRFPPRIMSIVRARVPPRSVEHVVLGAGLFDAPTALALGIVDQVASDARAVALARLEALAQHPRDAYAYAKRDLRGTEETLCPSAEHDRKLRDEVLPGWTSPAVRERLVRALKK